MTDDRLPPTAPDKPRHPSVIDLSALIDRAFGARKTATMDAHLEACLGCADQLSSLRAAKLALAGAGRPTAPAGAMDAAIVVSMASAAQAAREDALTMETLPAAATPPIAPDAEAPALAGVAPPAPATPVRQVSGGTSGRAPWMPAAWDTDKAKARAVSRHRRIRRLATAAASVLALGAIGGIAYAGLSGRHPSTSTSQSTSLPSNGGVSTTTVHHGASPTSTSKVNAGPVLPPLGAFSLQLRGVIGPDSCAKFSRHLIDVNGVLEAVNPPGQSDAVVPLPAAPGVTTTCVAVGPAFTTAWSKTVVSVASSGTGSTIELSLVLRPSAITNAPRLADAMAGKFAVEVLSQGADVGRAVWSHSKAGPVVKLTVTPQVATFLKQQLAAKA